MPKPWCGPKGSGLDEVERLRARVIAHSNAPFEPSGRNPKRQFHDRRYSALHEKLIIQEILNDLVHIGRRDDGQLVGVVGRIDERPLDNVPVLADHHRFDRFRHIGTMLRQFSR